MSASTFLQLFLLVDVFLIGVVGAIAAIHGFTHLRPAKPEPPKPAPPEQTALPAITKEHLLQTAQANFQAALDHSSVQLHHDLDVTTTKLNNLVEHLGTEIISNELERYRTELAAASQQAKTDIGGIRTEVAKYEADIKAKMVQEVAAEKQRLMQQIDTKLADAVGSFLVETLQHNVDLGAQSAYLTEMLEEHKADFAKGVSDEAEPTG